MAQAKLFQGLNKKKLRLAKPKGLDTLKLPKLSDTLPRYQKPITQVQPKNMMESLKQREIRADMTLQAMGEDPEKVLDNRWGIEKFLGLRPNQHWLFDIFELLDRPREAVAGIIKSVGDAASGEARGNIVESVFSNLWKGFSGRQKQSSLAAFASFGGKEAVESITKSSGFWKIAGSLTLDIFTDPLMYWQTPYRMIGKGIKFGVKGALKGTGAVISVLPGGKALLNKTNRMWRNVSNFLRTKFNVWPKASKQQVDTARKELVKKWSVKARRNPDIQSTFDKIQFDKFTPEEMTAYIKDPSMSPEIKEMAKDFRAFFQTRSKRDYNIFSQAISSQKQMTRFTQQRHIELLQEIGKDSYKLAGKHLSIWKNNPLSKSGKQIKKAYKITGKTTQQDVYDKIMQSVYSKVEEGMEFGTSPLRVLDDLANGSGSHFLGEAVNAQTKKQLFRDLKPIKNDIEELLGRPLRPAEWKLVPGEGAKKGFKTPGWVLRNNKVVQKESKKLFKNITEAIQQPDYNKMISSPYRSVLTLQRKGTIVLNMDVPFEKELARVLLSHKSTKGHFKALQTKGRLIKIKSTDDNFRQVLEHFMNRTATGQKLKEALLKSELSYWHPKLTDSHIKQIIIKERGLFKKMEIFNNSLKRYATLKDTEMLRLLGTSNLNAARKFMTTGKGKVLLKGKLKDINKTAKEVADIKNQMNEINQVLQNRFPRAALKTGEGMGDLQAQLYKANLKRTDKINQLKGQTESLIDIIDKVEMNNLLEQFTKMDKIDFWKGYKLASKGSKASAFKQKMELERLGKQWQTLNKKLTPRLERLQKGIKTIDARLTNSKQLPFGKAQFDTKQLVVKAKAKPIKKMLKWVGGKTPLKQKLVDTMPQGFNNYIEPFAGSGTLFFELQPQKYLLSDANNELMQVYKHLQGGKSKKFINELNKIQVAYNGLPNIQSKKAMFQKYKDLFNNPKATPFDKATALVVLNQTSWKGVFRVNKSNLFNVSFGQVQKVNFNVDNLNDISKYLKGSQGDMLMGDYRKALTQAKKGDFVYLDPPYDYVIPKTQKAPLYAPPLKKEAIKLDKVIKTDTLKKIRKTDGGKYFNDDYDDYFNETFDKIADDLAKKYDLKLDSSNQSNSLYLSHDDFDGQIRVSDHRIKGNELDIREYYYRETIEMNADTSEVSNLYREFLGKKKASKMMDDFGHLTEEADDIFDYDKFGNWLEKEGWGEFEGQQGWSIERISISEDNLKRFYADLEAMILNQAPSLSKQTKVVKATKGFGQYTKEGAFSQDDLAKEFIKLDKKGAKVMLSNHDTPRIRKLYEGFEFQKVKVKRQLSTGKTPGLLTADEVLVTNYQQGTKLTTEAILSKNSQQQLQKINDDFLKFVGNELDALITTPNKGIFQLNRAMLRSKDLTLKASYLRDFKKRFDNMGRWFDKRSYSLTKVQKQAIAQVDNIYLKSLNKIVQAKYLKYKTKFFADNPTHAVTDKLWNFLEDFREGVVSPLNKYFAKINKFNKSAVKHAGQMKQFVAKNEMIMQKIIKKINNTLGKFKESAQKTIKPAIKDFDNEINKITELQRKLETDTLYNAPLIEDTIDPKVVGATQANLKIQVATQHKLTQSYEELLKPLRSKKFALNKAEKLILNDIDVTKIYNNMAAVKSSMDDFLKQQGLDIGLWDNTSYMTHVKSFEATKWLILKNLPKDSVKFQHIAKQLESWKNVGDFFTTRRWIASARDVNEHFAFNILSTDPIESLGIKLKMLPEHILSRNMFKAGIEEKLIRPLYATERLEIMGEIDKLAKGELLTLNKFLPKEFTFIDEQVKKRLRKAVESFQISHPAQDKLITSIDDILQKDGIIHKGILEGITSQAKRSSLENMNEALSVFRRFVVKPWKALALFSWGYHIRNLLSNFLNGYLAGIPPLRYIKHMSNATQEMWTYYRKILPKMKKVGLLGTKDITSVAGRHKKLMSIFTANEKKVYTNFLEYIEKGLIGNTRISQDFYDMATLFTKLGKNKNLVQKFGSATMGKAFNTSMKLGHHADVISKIAGYTWAKTPKGIRKLAKLGIETPEQFTKFAFFDFGDLAPFEEKYMKSIFPFYTWFRKNAEFHARNFFTQTERYKRANRAITHWRDYITEGDDEKLTPWQFNSWQFPIFGNDKKITLLKFSPTYFDIYETFDKPLAKINPLIKIPIEMITKTNLWTGQPEEGAGNLAILSRQSLGDWTEWGKMIAGQWDDINRTKLGILGTRLHQAIQFSRGIRGVDPTTPANLIPSFVRDQNIERSKTSRLYLRTQLLEGRLQELRKQGRSIPNLSGISYDIQQGLLKLKRTGLV